MYIIIGLVFIFIGVFMIMYPKTFYGLTQNWKNDTKSSPSKLYIINTRIGGISLILIGLMALVLKFLI